MPEFTDTRGSTLVSTGDVPVSTTIRASRVSPHPNLLILVSYHPAVAPARTDGQTDIQGNGTERTGIGRGRRRTPGRGALDRRGSDRGSRDPRRAPQRAAQADDRTPPGGTGTVSLRDLSEAIAAAETGETPPPRNIRESVYNSLHQPHLPKLDSLGVVRYDSDRKDITVDGRAREVDLYMEVVTEYGITWGEYYRSLGVFALFSIVASEIGVPLLAEVSSLLVASAFLAVIGASIAYQLWTHRWRYLRLLA